MIIHSVIPEYRGHHNTLTLGNDPKLYGDRCRRERVRGTYRRLRQRLGLDAYQARMAVWELLFAAHMGNTPSQFQHNEPPKEA